LKCCAGPRDVGPLWLVRICASAPAVTSRSNCGQTNDATKIPKQLRPAAKRHSRRNQNLYRSNWSGLAPARKPESFKFDDIVDDSSYPRLIPICTVRPSTACPVARGSPVSWLPANLAPDLLWLPRAHSHSRRDDYPITTSGGDLVLCDATPGLQQRPHHPGPPQRSSGQPASPDNETRHHCHLLC
jgi:hypothetical protein